MTYYPIFDIVTMIKTLTPIQTLNITILIRTRKCNKLMLTLIMELEKTSNLDCMKCNTLVFLVIFGHVSEIFKTLNSCKAIYRDYIEL